ncbi:hypothetical protein P8452_35556 [Trifolium repens]|nr:hypothetical protein P8452_35556 [Trifolium repens]
MDMDIIKDILSDSLERLKVEFARSILESLGFWRVTLSFSQDEEFWTTWNSGLNLLKLLWCFTSWIDVYPKFYIVYMEDQILQLVVTWSHCCYAMDMESESTRCGGHYQGHSFGLMLKRDKIVERVILFWFYLSHHCILSGKIEMKASGYGKFQTINLIGNKMRRHNILFSFSFLIEGLIRISWTCFGRACNIS